MVEQKPIKRLWLWKNFVDGIPEYWAFDNRYPTRESGDPLTLGEPCGYALVKPSVNGEPDHPEATDETQIALIMRILKDAGNDKYRADLLAVIDTLAVALEQYADFPKEDATAQFKKGQWYEVIDGGELAQQALLAAAPYRKGEQG